MSDLSQATNSVTNAAPVDPSMATGIAGNDPAAVQALEGLQKFRGSLGFAAKSAITGAGMGAQAAQGAMNPLTAFLQGAAAGLQAPAQVFAQKQAQVKSTLDAMPFAVRFPDMAKRYPLLGVMPSALALETMKQIAIDTQKVIEEHAGRTLEKKIEYIQPGEDAENAAKLLEESDPEHTPRNPGSLIGMPKDSLQYFIKTNSESQSQFFRGGRKLTDSEMGELAAMVHRNDTSMTDTLSAYQRAQLALVYSRKYPGDSLTLRIANSKNIQNPQIQQQLRTMASIIGPSATGEPSLADQLIAKHAVLSNTETGGIPSATFNWVKTKYKSMSKSQALNDYNSLKNTYAMEVARAMTGGVPTDERIKLELSTLGAEQPHSAIVSAVENARMTIRKRMEEYTKTPPVSEPVVPTSSTIIVRVGPDGKRYRYDAITKVNLGAE